MSRPLLRPIPLDPADPAARGPRAALGQHVLILAAAEAAAHAAVGGGGGAGGGGGFSLLDTPQPATSCPTAALRLVCLAKHPVAFKIRTKRSAAFSVQLPHM